MTNFQNVKIEAIKSQLLNAMHFYVYINFRSTQPPFSLKELKFSRKRLGLFIKYLELEIHLQYSKPANLLKMVRARAQIK